MNLSVSNLGIEGLQDIEQIGSGGSSRVFRARQTDLDREVAVKVINSADDPDVVRRFDRERKAMGRLSQHEGIVPIYTTGVTDRGEPYLVMAYYPNGSLQDRLDHGPLGWAEATDYIEKAATTIAAAHNEGIVHLDLKPANILLTASNEPRIADFGIAKSTSVNATARTTGTAFTPAYSAPETFLDGMTSPASDVYGLGATLWALLVGYPPFLRPTDDNNLMAVIGRVVNNPVGDLRPICPAPICAVIERAMEKRPEDRFQTASDFSAALHHAVLQANANPTRLATVTTAEAATALVFPDARIGRLPDKQPRPASTAATESEKPFKHFGPQVASAPLVAREQAVDGADQDDTRLIAPSYFDAEPPIGTPSIFSIEPDPENEFMAGPAIFDTQLAPPPQNGPPPTTPVSFGTETEPVGPLGYSPSNGLEVTPSPALSEFDGSIFGSISSFDNPGQPEPPPGSASFDDPYFSPGMAAETSAFAADSLNHDSIVEPPRLTGDDGSNLRAIDRNDLQGLESESGPRRTWLALLLAGTTALIVAAALWATMDRDDDSTVEAAGGDPASVTTAPVTTSELSTTSTTFATTLTSQLTTSSLLGSSLTTTPTSVATTNRPITTSRPATTASPTTATPTTAPSTATTATTIATTVTSTSTSSTTATSTSSSSTSSSTTSSTIVGGTAQPPTNLVAVLDGPAVRLSWSGPDGEVQPVRYKVYRNDTLVNRVQVAEYLDGQVQAGAYDYSVSAVYLGNDTETESERTPITSVEIPLKLSVTAGTATSDSVPIGIEANGCVKYEINWESDGGEVGTHASDACTTGTTYTITGLVPESTYTITVTATTEAGLTAEADSLNVTTSTI